MFAYRIYFHTHDYRPFTPKKQKAEKQAFPLRVRRILVKDMASYLYIVNFWKKFHFKLK